MNTKHKKQITALLTAAVMLSLPVPELASAVQTAENTASAAEAAEQHIWSGEADTSWYDGARTYYNIYTPEQLAGLSQLVAEGNTMQGVTISLVSDLVLNDTSNFENWETEPPEQLWIPIGSEKAHTAFSGVFRGNGHTIEGMYAKAADAAGLFGFVYCGGIMQLIMKDGYAHARTTGDDVCAGMIAAKADGVLISECEVDGKVIVNAPPDIMNGYDPTYAGGIVGACTISSASVGAIFTEMLFMCMGFMVNPALLNDGSGGMIKSCLIADCLCSAEVVVYNATFDCNLGGLVGYGHTGLIANSVYLGDMHGTWIQEGAITGGGIAGTVFNCSVDRCYYVTNWLKGVGAVEAAGAHDIVDNSVCITENELTALDADGLHETLGAAYVSLDDSLRLQGDRKIWSVIYGESGDINKDGKVAVSDAVMMQKYLLMPEAELTNWHAADLFEDGILNAQDLTLLKRQLLQT